MQVLLVNFRWVVDLGVTIVPIRVGAFTGSPLRRSSWEALPRISVSTKLEV